MTSNMSLSSVFKSGGNPASAFWNVNMIVILVYIALAADDVNQARLEFVDNLW